jgi:serine/threonine protein phosphatase PrpC
MRERGELVVAVGVASQSGPRPDNQDCAAVRLGTALDRARQGVLAALADGVSGGRQGGVAAAMAVRLTMEGFAELPDTQGPARRLQTVLEAGNRWLHAQGQTEAMANCATTFTAFALRGRRAHLVHVGDSRAWRFSAGANLACLTSDHTRSEPDLRHVLIRALGIEAELRLDHATLELAERDRLLLTSDGVHGPLTPKRIAAILARQTSAQATADELVEAALEAGGQDNATALVIDIIRLPPITTAFWPGWRICPRLSPPRLARASMASGWSACSAPDATRYW